MKTDPRDDILIGAGDIARAAQVTAAAVSNWRSRHEDFPAPRQTSGASDLFSLREVETWLVENSKIDQPIAPSIVLWATTEALFTTWDLERSIQFLVATLVYAEACDLSERPDAAHRIEVPAGAGWAEVTGKQARDVQRRLVEGARQLEAANPVLDGLLADQLDQRPRLGDVLASTVLRTLEIVRGEEPLGAAHLFHELMDRQDSADRFAQEHGTPDDLAELMVRLLDPGAGRIVDPACGRGHLLVLAGLHASADELVGYEINRDALLWARSWALIYDLPANLHAQDSLRISEEEFGTASSVVLDAPLGLTAWGDAELYLDPRWTFGPPPVNSADFAWLQLATNLLASNGRAIVATGAGPTFRGGREQAIRQAMLDASVIEAVVQLPARMRRNTSIPLCLWLLRAPTSQAHQNAVLLIDASRLGTSGKSHHQLHDEDIEQVATLVRGWRNGDTPDSDLAVVVNVDELAAGNLDPKRYLHQGEHVDPDQLRDRVRELRAELSEVTPRLTELLSSVLAASKDDR